MSADTHLSSARALAAEEAAHALDAAVFVVETVPGGRGDEGLAQQKASAPEEWTGSCSNPPSVALLTALSSLLLTYLHHLELFAPLAVSLSFCIPPCVRTQLCAAETFQWQGTRWDFLVFGGPEEQIRRKQPEKRDAAAVLG